MGKGLLIVGAVAAGLVAAFYFMGKPSAGKGDVAPASEENPELAIPTETSENVAPQLASEERGLVYEKVPAAGLVVEDRSIAYSPTTIAHNTATYNIVQEAAPEPAPVPVANDINPDTNQTNLREDPITNATVNAVEPSTGIAPITYREPVHEAEVYTSIRRH